MSSASLSKETAAPVAVQVKEEKDFFKKLSTKNHEKAKTPKQPTIPFKDMFRFATVKEKYLLCVGALFAAISGVSMPLMTLIMSEFLNGFLEHDILVAAGKAQLAKSNLNKLVSKYCLYFIAIAVANFIVSYFVYIIWNVVAENQAKRIREAFYSAILSQEVSWFDNISAGELTTRITSDVTVIQDGIDEKMGFLVQYFSTFLSGIILAFIRGPKMAVVVLVIIPCLLVSSSVMAKRVVKFTRLVMDSYASAGGVATEVLSSMRTVIAFNSQEKELSRFDQKIEVACSNGKKKARALGLGIGTIFFFLFANYSLGFWYGARLVRNGTYNPGQVLNVFFALMMGGFSLSGAAPSISAITSARGAAAKLFQIIDRKSSIDATDDKKGIKVDELRGNIEFKNVTFAYPSRPDVTTMKNFSISVKSGQKVALVGESGSGKSTCVALVQRLYDVANGCVLIDGKDIKEYNVKSLRQNIGLVSQEPILFGTTIYENIVWGVKDLENNPPTREDVIQVCKNANIYDFIESLPKKFETVVGERGALLSGGQKQRICIARALIRNPSILLLDEATSALDTESEKLVQDALDKNSGGRTTITIAHRLSTIKDSDVIYVVGEGSILEQGTHHDLIQLKGAYASLVKAQEVKKGDAVHGQEASSPRALAKTVTSKSVARGPTASDVSSDFDKDRAGLEEEKPKSSFKALANLYSKNFSEIKIFVPGFFVTLVDGALFPCFSIVFAGMLTSLNIQDKSKQKSKTDIYALVFFCFAVLNFLTVSLRTYLFGYGSENLTKKLRYDLFKSMLRQDMEFFDKEENGTGVLTSRLSSEASQVNKIGTDVIPMVLSAASSLVTGLIIAFVRSWKLTLVICAAIPILVISQSKQSRGLVKNVNANKKAGEVAAQDASESISNIKTVTSLSRETMFMHSFVKNGLDAYNATVKSFYINGIYYGASQAAMFLIYALTFYTGSKFINNDSLSTNGMFNTMYAIVFAAFSLSRTSQVLGAVPKALIAAEKITETIEKYPKVDITAAGGKNPSAKLGTITLKDTEFTYPTRPNTKILKGINLSANPGQSIALVGSSGSGKSTVINLILRLYDVEAGSVEVEGIDVREWNLKNLREHPALVSQEPILFDCSVTENILYGKPDATQFEVEEAAKNANIHDLLMSLPDGYDTRVGGNGGQLSGGQKQRIAIARALIRNPKLLLLDEATSALDAESEVVVQGVLDKASKERTTITVAHRLSTIQNSDLILVFKNGEIVERGTHSSLIAENGVYNSLVVQQSLAV